MKNSAELSLELENKQVTFQRSLRWLFLTEVHKKFAIRLFLIVQKRENRFLELFIVY